MLEAEWESSTNPSAMLAWLTTTPTGSAESAKRRSSPPYPSDRKLRLYAVACVRSCWALLHDPRSRAAVEVAELFADGEATEKELIVAQEYSEFDEDDNSRPYAWNATATCFLSVAEALSEIVRDQFPLPPAAQAELLRSIVGNPFAPVVLTPEEPANVFEALDVLAREAKRDPKPIYIPRTCLTGTVKGLAAAAYSERGRKCLACNQWTDCKWCGNTRRISDGSLDNDRLAILADALEDSGCQDAAILDSLRARIWCLACNGDGVVERNRIVSECPTCKGAGHIVAAGLKRWRGYWALDVLLKKE